MPSELITLTVDNMRCETPQLCVCYARGSVFKKEGNFYRVERGARSVVHRVLCLMQYYGTRCGQCPNSSIKIVLEPPSGTP